MRLLPRLKKTLEKLMERSTACPQCRGAICPFPTRVLTLSPMYHFTCSNCGCVCHTGPTSYVVMTVGAIIVFSHVFNTRTYGYRTRIAFARASVAYFVLGIIMMAIIPLKEVRKK